MCVFRCDSRLLDGAVKTHVLCLQNLPDNTEEADLVKLFAEMEGYKEVY